MNPGSPEAAANGCTCPTMDNANGQGVRTRDGVLVYWIDSRCPVHNKQTSNWHDESDNIKDIFSKT